MKSFEGWAYSLREQPYGAMNWFRGVSEALDALAREREGKRPSVAELLEFRRQWESLPPDYMNVLPPEPRSVSHWGMFA